METRVLPSPRTPLKSGAEIKLEHHSLLPVFDTGLGLGTEASLQRSPATQRLYGRIVILSVPFRGSYLCRREEEKENSKTTISILQLHWCKDIYIKMFLFFPF